MKKKALFTILLLLLIFQLSFGQETQSQNQPFWESEDFSIRLTVALVTALLSFLTAYFIFLNQKKNQKRKQLSYDLNISHGLVEVGKEIEKYIKIQYKDRPTDNLSIANFTVQNTGNTVVKGQEIRFTLESESAFIDRFFDPKPEEEWGVKEVPASKDGDKKIYIRQLEKEQKVTIKFIVSGQDCKLKIVPHNDEGDVEFLPRSFSKIQDDAETLKRFFTIALLIVITFVVLGGINLDFFGAWYPISIPSFVSIFILVFGIKDIVKGIKILADRILNGEDRADLIIKEAKNAIFHSTIDVGSDFRLGDGKIPVEEEKKTDAQQSA